MAFLKKHPVAGGHRGIDMNNGPILKNLLLFSIPMMLSGIVQLLFNAADIAVAGQYIGDAELAAIGATATLINLLVNLFVGVSVGVSVSLGRAYGSGDQRKIHLLTHTAMFFSVLWGAVVSAISFFGAETLLRLMQIPEHLLPLAVRYLRFYACGMVGSSLFNFGCAVLRATGNIRQPLYCLAISCGLNFVLNFVFVLGFDMGLDGVALATAISLWVMGLMIVVCMMRGNGQAKLSLRHLRLHGKTLGEILGLGIPAGLQSIFLPLSNIVLQTYINAFGEVVIAANSAACNVESIVYQALVGFYHACMAFVSCNMGAGNWQRIRKIFRNSLCAVAVTGLVLGFGVILLGRPLLGMYTDSPEIIEQGRLRFMFTCTTYFICGLMEVTVGAVRGLGSSVQPMIISVLGICGVRIAWVLAVFQTEQFCRVEFVYASYPLSWAVTLIAQGIWLFVLAKKLRQQRNIPLYMFKAPKGE